MYICVCESRNGCVSVIPDGGNTGENANELGQQYISSMGRQNEVYLTLNGLDTYL